MADSKKTSKAGTVRLKGTAPKRTAKKLPKARSKPVGNAKTSTMSKKQHLKLAKQHMAKASYHMICAGEWDK